MGLKQWLIKRYLAKEAESMWNNLKGKKTYLTGLIAVIYFLSAAASNHISWQAAIDGIFISIQSMNIRHAIQNG